MDGYEVCRKIRENEKLSKVRIIFVSANAMIKEKQKAYDVGGDGYITKPFDHLDLMKKISEIMVD